MDRYPYLRFDEMEEPMQVTYLNVTTQGLNKEDLEENAWEIAKRFFEPADYDIMNATDARVTELPYEQTYEISEPTYVFEADFTFRLLP